MVATHIEPRNWDDLCAILEERAQKTWFGAMFTQETPVRVEAIIWPRRTLSCPHIVEYWLDSVKEKFPGQSFVLIDAQTGISFAGHVKH